MDHSENSALFGWGREDRPNFATWLMNRVRPGRVLNILTDQYVSPTFNTELAGLFMEIAERRLTSILHVVKADRERRYQLAPKIAVVFGPSKGLLRPVMAESLNWRARSPRDFSFSIEKVTSELKLETLTLTQARSWMRREERKRGL